MDVDLADLFLFWYGCLPHLTYVKRMTEIDIHTQWTTIWFSKTKDTDLYLKRFEPLLQECLTEVTDEMPLEKRMALIILYDQIPRNIYRGTPKAYEYDQIAYGLTQSLINSQLSLPTAFQLTLLICLLHQEDLWVHQKLLEFRETISLYRNGVLSATIDKMIYLHHLRLELFGRYPERNQYLGRKSTQGEIIFLSAIY